MIAKVLAWFIALYYIGTRDQNLGMTFLLGTGFYAVLSHICCSPEDKSEDGYSAYAALNEDGYRLPGTFTAEQYEGELRHRPRKKEKIEVRANAKEQLQEHYERKSKAANKPCVCGSGKKYKKCCGRPGKKLKEEFDEWEEEWT
eukprot:CAMPEP_0170179400 /NCGR_PEP_ID=MMETSP0040_2-20121228/17491_1 /TAXON_ID=641309 /ORGANISM="Lotharella oceanica, Strain CCMP622" /LENGTH=143 /DNA_ID=CAMNT_0010423439 /DNA_START=53 /DNA_END=484 /DNA_ORIENTATION=+